MTELYNTTKKLAGKYSKPERPMKDKDGRSIITGDEQQMEGALCRSTKPTSSTETTRHHTG